MQQKIANDILDRLAGTEKNSAQIRIGVVTANSPLAVKIGDGTAQLATTVIPVAVGDTVVALQQGNMPPIIWGKNTNLGTVLLPPTDVTYAAGWANLGAPYEEVRYYKDLSGLVHLEGYTTRTGAAFAFAGAGATIFTLPVGFRPEKNMDFVDRGHDGTRGYPVIIRVLPDGSVLVAGASGRGDDGNAATAASGSLISVSGIHFRPIGV